MPILGCGWTAEKLRWESWEVVSLPDKEIANYKSALEKAQKANQWLPNDPFVVNVLGIAHYRLGAFEDALETLKRSAEIRAQKYLDSEPANLAFTAMVLHKLDQIEEAKAALELVKDLCKEEELAEDMEGQAFLAEAEKLITSEEQ